MGWNISSSAERVSTGVQVLAMSTTSSLAYLIVMQSRWRGRERGIREMQFKGRVGSLVLDAPTAEADSFISYDGRCNVYVYLQVAVGVKWDNRTLQVCQKGKVLKRFGAWGKVGGIGRKGVKQGIHTPLP